MKRIILIAIMAGLAATAPAQTTSSSDEGPTVRIFAPEYRIELPARPYRMAPGEFEPYRRIYSLSNGDEMTLKQRGQRMYANLNGRADQELVAAAHNIFVAKDRNLKMTLFLDRFSEEITGEVLIRTTPSIAAVNRGEKAEVRRLIAGQ